MKTVANEIGTYLTTERNGLKLMLERAAKAGNYSEAAILKAKLEQTERVLSKLYYARRNAEE